MDRIDYSKWILEEASDGGLPKDKHFVEAEFNGERLKIRRTMNADVEGEMGFTITNFSRSQSLVNTDKQYGIYTDQLLIDFIIPVLESHN